MWNDNTDQDDAQSVARLGPLAGIRVIDLTLALAGPYCTLLLGGLGAEVIKVEAPGGSDIARNNPPYCAGSDFNYGDRQPEEVSLLMLDRHRNKKSITLDLKQEEGKAIFIQLVKQADVLVENFSVGTVERLGIDYETLRAANPALIYTSVSSIGKDAPPEMKGMDIIVQALSGIMEVTGFPDGPPSRIGIPLADMIAPHYALSGILAALIHRGRTGKGQKIEVSMLDTLTALLALEHFDVLTPKGASPRTGNNQDRLTPFGIYETRDSHVAIAAPQDAWAHSLFRAMGRPELASDERFRTRGGRAVNAKLINGIIEEWTRQHTTDFLIKLLASNSVTCGRCGGASRGRIFEQPKRT